MDFNKCVTPGLTFVLLWPHNVYFWLSGNQVLKHDQLLSLCCPDPDWLTCTNSIVDVMCA